MLRRPRRGWGCASGRAMAGIRDADLRHGAPACKAAPNSSRSISRRSAISAGAASTSSASIGEGRVDRSGCCAIRGKGHVRQFSDYYLDLDAVLRRRWRRATSPKPWFVVAHSMGAAIFLSRLGRGATPALRAALTSPMIGFSPRIAPRYTAVIAARACRASAWGAVSCPGGGPASIIAMPFENNRLVDGSSAVMSAMPQFSPPRPISGSALRRRLDSLPPAI